jgi:hypothetical protein
VAQVLVTGETANCRRVEAESRGSTHFSVHDGSQHLPLESVQRRAATQVKVSVDGTSWVRHAEIDGQDLEDAWYYSAILPFDPPKEDAADPARLLWYDRQDVRHATVSSIGKSTTRRHSV